MEEEVPEFSNQDAIAWLLAAGILTLVLILLFKISHSLFGESSISALTAFGTGVSSVISVILAALYKRQTKILRKHGEHLNKQAEFMELQFIPDIYPKDEPSFENDSVKIKLENRGSGSATDLKLVTRIEFSDSDNYDSPLAGESELERDGDDRSGEKHLESGVSGTYSAKSKLQTKSISPEERTRSFQNIIKNMKGDVEEVRISLSVKSQGVSGRTGSTHILTSEAFYTTIDEMEENTLEECYRVSKPA